MNEPKKNSKPIKIIAIILCVLFIIMVCLFVLVLASVCSLKRFIGNVFNPTRSHSVYTTEFTEFAESTTTTEPSTTSPVSVTLTETDTPEKTTIKPTTTIAPEKKSLSNFIDTSKRYNYASLDKDISKLASLYSNIVSVSTIGKSVNGRAIKLLKVGKGDKKAFTCAAMHAREIITSKYIMLCVFEYCEAYNSKSGRYGSYNVKNLLDEYTLYIVPCVNPDGMEIVSNKKVPNAYIEDFSRYDYKANTNGVDLNRNFPLAWKQIDNGVTKPANELYKGESAGSEPETKCIMSLCKGNNFEFALSFHVKGECIFWGDTYDTTHNEDYIQFAERLAYLTDFRLTPESSDVNSYGGGFENWFRHTYSKPGFCVELISHKHTTSPTDNTDYRNFDDTVKWNVSKYILLESMYYNK